MAKGNGGFTLLEVMVASTFLTASLLGLTSVLISNERSQELTAQEIVLTNAFRNVAERVRSSTFNETVANFQGAVFAVDELGGTATVTLFVDETDASTEAQILGLPRDLDGDGQATNVNVAASYMLLPVRIEIDWPTASGTDTRSFYYFLSLEE